MAKRIRGFTKQKYEKWLKEGRGQGIGSQYKPWLTIQDVGSDGRSTRILGIKTGRQHDLLSDNELNYFYISEHSDYIVDIREQFPLLPIEQTIEIAEELNIEHHKDPKTHENIVITTDFLLTVNKGGKNIILARTIKSMDDLHDFRQMEKFEIERRYWSLKGIHWAIVTDQEIDKIFASNISDVYSFYNLENVLGFENLTNTQIFNLVEAFKSEIIGENIIIRDVANDFDMRMMLKPGNSISLFKHLIATKSIKIDLHELLNIDLPISVKLR